MKTLGLTGGTSWYSTVDYYRYVNEAINDAYGNGTNPRRKMDLLRDSPLEEPELAPLRIFVNKHRSRRADLAGSIKFGCGLHF